MKKFLLFIALVLSVGVYASVEIKENAKPENVSMTSNAGDYEFVCNLSCKCINIDTGKVSTVGGTLYKGVNTCGVYYLVVAGRKYNVYKNTLSTYKGVDVSDYNSYAQGDGWRYFFFY